MNTRSSPSSTRLIDPAAYGGPPNSSIATATPIDPYANKFAGNDDRTAVLGRLSAPGGGGGLVSTDRFNSGALQRQFQSTGAATLIGPLTDFTSFSGMAIHPSGGHNLHLGCLRPFDRRVVAGHDRPDHRPGDDHRPAVRSGLRRVRYDIHALVDSRRHALRFQHHPGIGIDEHVSTASSRPRSWFRFDARADRKRRPLTRPIGHGLRDRPVHNRHLHDQCEHGRQPVRRELGSRFQRSRSGSRSRAAASTALGNTTGTVNQRPLYQVDPIHRGRAPFDRPQRHGVQSGRHDVPAGRARAAAAPPRRARPTRSRSIRVKAPRLPSRA